MSNYDAAVAVAGMRAAMQVGAAMPSEFGSEQLDPGPILSNDGFLAWIKANSGTAFHFAGTARMGTDDMSVVDPTTIRVRGVDGLRMVDASVTRPAR
jgi:choline dehydrogenase